MTAQKTAAAANVTFLGAAPSLDDTAKGTEEILKNIKAAQNARQQVVTNVQAALSAFSK